MVTNHLVLCLAAWCGAIVPVTGPTSTSERISLACTGTLQVADSTVASPVITNGTIDLAKGHVYGFGAGAERIVLVTATQIAFASPERAGGGQLVDGSINRTTGDTVVRVRSAGDPTHFLIAMTLKCELDPPAS